MANLPEVGLIQNYPALRMVATFPTPDRLAFLLEGRAGVGDAGAGIFTWVPTSVDADNDDTVIRPDDRASTPGRWVKL